MWKTEGLLCQQLNYVNPATVKRTDWPTQQNRNVDYNNIVDGNNHYDNSDDENNKINNKNLLKPLSRHYTALLHLFKTTV